MVNLIDYYVQFENKYRSLDIIDSNWYKNELKITSYCKKSNVKNINGNYSEEWYRARFVYTIICSGYYPRENICIDCPLPKGNGGKKIIPDIIIFTSSKWNEWLSENDYEKLREHILIVCEVKDNSNEIANAIEKQIEVALERRLKKYKFEDIAYGFYIDNKDDIILLKKEGTAPLERYNIDNAINASNYIDALNVAKRDTLNSLPKFDFLQKHIDKSKRKYEYTYNDMTPLSEKGFQAILDTLQREQDKLKVFNTKELLVEALALKVYDEKTIYGTNNFSRFYITDDEIKPNGSAINSFRLRINELYGEAQNTYRILSEKRIFRYRVQKDSLIPLSSDDEKMYICIVKAFQGKGILSGNSQNFNQTIFNNFGNKAEQNVAGQFFTPVQIIDAIVKIMNPRLKESVADPCSGICDFLAMAWRHSKSQGAALNYFGFDISNEVLKLAELNLVLNGDGNATIKKCNTIYEKLCESDYYTDITSFSTENYDIESWTNKDDENKNIKKYHCIMTNPPFGKGRDLKTGKNGEWDFGLTKSNMAMYETWNLLGCPKSIDMGILFLENAYKMTIKGGRFAIVLSNSIVSIPSLKKIREWLLTKVRLVAILDMPQNSFGDTPVATTVLIAYKPKDNEFYLLENDYEVYIKEINFTGYEVKKIKRSIVFEPIKLLDETTFEDTGKLKEDFTSMLNDFNEYMKRQEKPIKDAFGR